MAIRHNLIASSSYLSVYYPLRHLLISIIIPFVIPIRTASFRLTVRNKSSPFIVDLFLSPSSILVYIHIQIIFVEHPWRDTQKLDQSSSRILIFGLSRENDWVGN